MWSPIPTTLLELISAAAAAVRIHVWDDYDDNDDDVRRRRYGPDNDDNDE